MMIYDRSMIDALCKGNYKLYIRGYFTLFPNLIAKKSYNWWVTRRFWGFRQQISKTKYLKISQNVGLKYLEASGEHCITCAKWLLSHLGRGLSENSDTSIRGIWNALLSHPASEFRMWNIRGGMSAAAEFQMWYIQVESGRRRNVMASTGCNGGGRI